MTSFDDIASSSSSQWTNEASTDRRLDVAINARSSSENHTSKWISVEFFPPRTPEGVDNLFETLETLKKYNPLFIDVTWGAGGTTSDLTLELCKKIHVTHGLRVNMHLTCTNMGEEKVDVALKATKDIGIRNILALRGDPPLGQTKWEAKEGGFGSALDLVKHIRSSYNHDDFCVSVAGYPEGHPSRISTFKSLENLSASETSRHSVDVDEDGQTIYLTCTDDDFKKEISYLKEKIDAGANAVITQMFFDAEVFIAFVTTCREAGITVPIIPGIMCVSSYAGFKKMVKFCKTRVPDEVLKKIEEARDNDEELKKYGVELGVSMCKRLLSAGAAGLHFYTLNSPVATSAIIDQLEL